MTNSGKYYIYFHGLSIYNALELLVVRYTILITCVFFSEIDDQTSLHSGPNNARKWAF